MGGNDLTYSITFVAFVACSGTEPHVASASLSQLDEGPSGSGRGLLVSALPKAANESLKRRIPASDAMQGEPVCIYLLLKREYEKS